MSMYIVSVLFNLFILFPIVSKINTYYEKEIVGLTIKRNLKDPLKILLIFISMLGFVGSMIMLIFIATLATLIFIYENRPNE